MSSVKPNIDQKNCFYKPYSCVINDCSRITKLRVVFDKSAKTNSGESLNYTLINGSKIQSDLLDIVIRLKIMYFWLIS